MDRILALPLFSRVTPYEIDFASTGATFLNDIVFVSDRHAILTESKQKALYVVDVVSKKIQKLAYPKSFGAPNGIAFDKEKRLLFVAANLSHGFGAPEGNGQILVFRISSRAGVVILQAGTNVSWGRFIDGIEPVPGTTKLLVSDWSSATDPGKLAVIDYAKQKVLLERKVSANGFADFAIVPERKLIVAPDLITGYVYFYKDTFKRRR
jgi:hypothetical protein